MKINRISRIGLATVGVLAAAVVGLGAGSALASGTTELAPAGLTAADGTATQPMPTPTFPTNENGQSYGSAADAISPDTEPDLIAALATNGRTGYVTKVDLDRANGTTAAESFTSPEDALRWQDSEGQLDHTIPVYAQDGTTVIGEFTVIGQAAAAKQAAAAGTSPTD